MASYRINDRQKALLERIDRGHEPVTSKEPALAVSVYALRSRGLVRTPRRGGIWAAEITDAGRYYLEHGRHPKEDQRPESAADAPGPPAARAKPERPVPRVEPEDLIRRLTEAGGTLRIQDPEPEIRAAWRSAIHRTMTSGLVPEGHALGHSGRLHGDLRIWLAPETSGPAESPQPAIAVPERLARPHPVVAALRDEPRRLPISKPVVPRALRLLHAIATEAERRGYAVTLPTGPRDGVMAVRVNGHSYPIAIRELSTRTPHIPTARELAEKQRSSWVRIPEYDYSPSGELEMTLPKDYSGRTSVFADRKRWRLDDKLPELLAEIEARAARDEARRLERQAEEERRLEARRETVSRAYDRLVEHTRAEALLGQLRDWRRAHDIRAFSAAVRAARSEGSDAAADPAEEAWLAWAEAYADRLDPIRRPLGSPPDPKPDSEQLQPFLGWIPYPDDLAPLRARLQQDGDAAR